MEDSIPGGLGCMNWEDNHAGKRGPQPQQDVSPDIGGDFG
jgi:hypothetical protein